MKGDSTRIVQLSLARLDGIERRAYVEGWRWGLTCGLLTGLCTTAMAAWLLQVVAEAVVR